MELWKPIKNYENLYEVSNLGRIRSKDRYVDYKPHGQSKPVLKKGQIMKPFYNKQTGYRGIRLISKDGIETTYSIHYLVAEMFCEKKVNAEYINHKNGRKLDNRANNLEWCTYEKNHRHAYKTKSKECEHKKAVFCEELNKQFDGVNDAAIFIKDTTEITAKLSTIRGNIRECAKGRIKTAYRYTWKFI